MKFASKGFTPSSNVYEEQDSGRIKQEYIRDLSDNKLFKNIQVDDLSAITNDNTEWYLDGDGVVWKTCSSVETLYITVKNKTTGEEFDIDNITKFKGATKNISENSWLGIENVKRVAKGETPYTVEDFEIEQKSRLNFTSEDKAFEQAQIMLRTKLKNLREQFQIKNIKFCIGSGECFRHSLDTVELYKGQRSELRPILLKRVRQWVLDELNGLEAPAGFENDDFVEWHAAEGFKDFKRTGIVSKGCIGEDKDMLSNAKLLINFGVHTGEDNPNKGKFKYPKPWLIGDSSMSVGEVDLIIKGVKNPKKECKATGLVWLVLQSFLLGDTADHYKPLQHLKHYKTNYGDVKAYEDFVGLKTPLEVLQKVVDIYAEFFPYGIQYTSHKGEDLDVDTMTYMETYFKVAYMTRNSNDLTTFGKLCEAFKVDTSKIVNNNRYTPPTKVFVGNEEKLLESVEVLQKVLKETMKGLKSMKKTNAAVQIDLIKEQLESILDIESHYEMKQELKPQFADKISVEEKQ